MSLVAKAGAPSVSYFDVHASEFVVREGDAFVHPDLTDVSAIRWEMRGPHSRGTYPADIVTQSDDVIRTSRSHTKYDFPTEGHYDVRAVLTLPAGVMFGSWHVLRVER